MIFLNAALQKIALLRPDSISSLAGIEGVSEQKASKYGQKVVEVIKTFCEKRNLTLQNAKALSSIQASSQIGAQKHASMDANGWLSALTDRKRSRNDTTSEALPQDLSESQLETYSMFYQGQSVEEIASVRSLKTSTILGHIAIAVSRGFSVDWARLPVTPKQETDFQKVSEECPNLSSLTMLKELMPGGCSWETIRLLRAKFLAKKRLERSSQQNANSFAANTTFPPASSPALASSAIQSTPTEQSAWSYLQDVPSTNSNHVNSSVPSKQASPGSTQYHQLFKRHKSNTICPDLYSGSDTESDSEIQEQTASDSRSPMFVKFNGTKECSISCNQFSKTQSCSSQEDEVSPNYKTFQRKEEPYFGPPKDSSTTDHANVKVEERGGQDSTPTVNSLDMQKRRNLLPVNKNTVLTYMASMPPGVTVSDLTEFFCCSNEEVQQVMQGLETEFIIFCKNGRFHFL